ncbi:Protein of unknown function wound-induced - like 1 [Theobroma cacao]|uniref:Uncharacterized protein LOC18608618 n=2 Tax=Theobroma cacao TaxID=3641 RepID=A0AB32VHJ2_THECC|nr:PREDICTED: uncharacterized protein LOC18608618 [Theobroma cacao]EOX99299.1 Uncharacterized protein TCM_007932 [Theobroma cacao]WRX13320.1 Protein of unknown function wound-induced - like 1 [Theobroma cacao]
MNWSAGSKAWIVAASIGAVEALKNHNHAMKSLNQHAKNSVRSFSQAKKLSSSAMASSKKTKQADDSLRKVMYLSCWGPY